MAATNPGPPATGSEEAENPHEGAASTLNSSSSKVPEEKTTPAEDSDPDLEDLDDILDEFSTSNPPKTQSKPTPSASGPGRPAPPQNTASEDDFLAGLQKEMSNLLSSQNIPVTNHTAEGKPDPEAEAADIANMGKELDDFTRQMEKEGVKPEDLLKSILGKDADKLLDSAEKAEEEGSAQPTKKDNEAFEETIRKTMDRLKTSDSSATNAAQQAPSSDEDMLASLLKAMEQEQGEGGEGEGDLSKMFLGMMEQLTNKDMLYEPMKELNTKFDPWLRDNEQKVSKEDLERYRTQRVIVKEIVGKFEEKGYSDENPECRSFIWEKMQAMQAAGSPPNDLISNPWPGLMGGGGEDPLGACPTQ
ncbi:MAG: hypothetical protein Q9227_008929 [Pyrenula ochraceoflavens]